MNENIFSTAWKSFSIHENNAIRNKNNNNNNEKKKRKGRKEEPYSNKIIILPLIIVHTVFSFHYRIISRFTVNKRVSLSCFGPGNFIESSNLTLSRGRLRIKIGTSVRWSNPSTDKSTTKERSYPAPPSSTIFSNLFDRPTNSAPSVPVTLSAERINELLQNNATTVHAGGSFDFRTLRVHAQRPT